MKHSVLCARTWLIIFTLLTVSSVHSFAETAHPSYANPVTEVTNAIAPLHAASSALTKDGGGRQPVQASPVTLGWSTAGSMSVARDAHTATLLRSGKVLVTGGQDSSHNALASAELYDPNSNSWSSAGSMNIARWLPTATLLPSGKVLVTGGACGYGCVTESVELYDPNTNSWSTAPSMGTARYQHTATLLSSGDVLVAGGGNVSTISLATAELYNAASNTWSPAGQMAARRYGHTATLLPLGHVLMAGGGDINANSLASAELYNAASDTWSPAGRMNTARYIHEAALLLSGNVLVMGGYRWASGNYSHLACAEIYDALSNTWSAATSMTVDRMGHTATSLFSGKVLVAGGATYGAAMSASAEIYDPDSDTWSLTANMSTERESHTATLLPSGQVLVAGGAYGQQYRATAELYNPGSTISGRVTDAASQPLTDVTVSAGAGSSATTDSNGAYTISGLAAGTYTLTPSKSGYSFFPRTVSVPPDALDVSFAPWDCGLAGVPQYYQGWPSTPDSLPNKPSWYANAYGNPLNYPDTDTVNTVGKWGCNLSCASMVTSYFGRDALAPFETDPGKLNAWLRTNEGYDSENGVVYAKIADYAWRNGVSLFLNGIGGRNDQKLDQHLCSGNPAMIRVATAYGSHYVLATGKTTLSGKTTYTINDPIWGQTTLRDHYGNNYQAAYYYRRGPGIYRASMMQFNVHSPVHLVVTDPLGRKSGYDPRAGTSWDEIPNAGYITETITAPDGTSLPELKIFAASQPIGGQYRLEVIGYADGAYSIDAFQTDLTGDTTIESFSGMATPGSADHLAVNYTPSKTYLPMIQAGH